MIGRPPGREAGSLQEWGKAQVRVSHLLQNSIGRQSLQVLQVGVEEGAVAQTGTQKPFHNVAYRTIIREPYPLGCAHEAT